MATVKALHIAIGARVEGFQRGMTKAQRSLRNFEKSTRRARGMVVGATGAMARGFAALGAAATIAIADSIRVFADFETSMLRVKAISGATGEEFKSLTDLAKELGSTTAFTAREAAQAMGFLAQAGFDVGEVHQALPKVLSLAAAGQLDLAQAADITASVLRGFGLDASESGRVADVLAAAASKSNTSVEGMGEAFKFAGPVASAMGVSLEETAAALGVLSNAGLKGSLAGTGLRMVLVKMGEDVAGAGGLTQALETLNTEGVQAVVETMKQLDARAGTAAVALTGQMGVLKQLHKEMQSVDGISDRMAETMLSGIGGSAVKTGSALEVLRIQIGETFEGFGTGFFDELTRIFQTLGEMFSKMELNFEGLEQAGKATAQVLLFAFEGLASAIAMVIDFVMSKIVHVADEMRRLNLSVERLSFGKIQILSDEELSVLNEFIHAEKRGDSRLDKVTSFFAKLDSLLAPTASVGENAAQNVADGLASPTFLEEMSKFFTESERRQILDGQAPRMAVETGRSAKLDEFMASIFAMARKNRIAQGLPVEPLFDFTGKKTEELDEFLKGMAALPEDVMKMMEARGLGQFADKLLASEISEGDLGKLTKLLDQSEILRGDAGIFEEVRNAILESFIDLPEPEKKEPEDPVQGFAETIDTVLGQVRVDPLAGKKDSQNLDTIAKASQRTARALESSGGAFS